MASTQYHGSQQGRSTCRRKNFCIRALIEVIFTPLERSWCVEQHQGVGRYVDKVLTTKIPFDVSKCILKGTEKPSIHGWDDAPWYPKVHPNMFKEHIFCFLFFHGLFTKHNNELLAKPVNYHKQIVMSLPSCWKTTKKIHGNAFPWLSGYR